MKIEDAIQQTKFKSEYHKMVINILFTSKWIEEQNAVVLKPFGISNQQFNILRILRGQHPKCASMTTLQERMLDKMSNASRLVEKLRVKGYVLRTIDEKNRRQVKVNITDKGLEILQKIDVIMANKEKEFEKFSVDEAFVLNDLLDKLRN